MTFAASTIAPEATQLISFEDLLWLTAVRKAQKGTTVPRRVLGVLAEAGLIERNGEAWLLTAAGHEALAAWSLDK
jgi:hypothetical protein